MAKVHLHDGVKRWDELKPGSLFYVMLGGHGCIGIKAEGTDAKGSKCERCVLIALAAKTVFRMSTPLKIYKSVLCSTLRELLSCRVSRQ